MVATPTPTMPMHNLWWCAWAVILPPSRACSAWAPSNWCLSCPKSLWKVVEMQQLDCRYIDIHRQLPPYIFDHLWNHSESGSKVTSAPRCTKYRQVIHGNPLSWLQRANHATPSVVAKLVYGHGNNWKHRTFSHKSRKSSVWDLEENHRKSIKQW